MRILTHRSAVAIIAALIGCDTTPSTKPDTHPIVGTWKHESYRNSLESTLLARVTFRENGTFRIREDITPLPDAAKGVRYLVSDDIESVSVEYQGRWIAYADPNIIDLTFDQRYLYFNDEYASYAPDSPPEFFWDLISINQLCCIFSFTVVGGDDLLLFLSEGNGDNSPTYFSLFDRGNGSLFSRTE